MDGSGGEAARTPPARGFQDLAAPLLLFAATVLLFHRFLLWNGHQVVSLSGEDLTGQFVWWRRFGFEELRNGRLALWNPHLFCGEPFFGGFQSALLYPPNWLFMVLPLAFALNLSAALHVFLAGWFTYLWVRGRGSRPASALLASFAFMFGGAFFLHLVPGHLPNLCSMAWIPLVFLAIDKYRERSRAGWVAFGAAAIALQIFSGHIQYVYYTFLMVVPYVLAGLSGTAKKGRFLLGVAFMYAGAAMLAAVQLGAGVAAAGESVRAQKLSIDLLDTADLSPERLWCLLMPRFFGGMGDYWGGGLYWEGAMFVSVTAFLLAIFGLFRSRRGEKWTFAVLGLFFILLAVGTRTPFFAFFCEHVPIFGHFRGVGKLNILITLCLSALAAMGMDAVLDDPGNLKGIGWGLVRAGMAVAVLGALFWALPHLGAGKVFRQFVGHVPGMAGSLGLLAALLLVIAALAFLGGKKGVWRYGLVVLAFGELFLFARANMPSFDLEALEKKVVTVQATYDRDPGEYRVLVGSSNDTLGTKGFDVWGEDPAVPFRYARFAAAAQHYDLERDILRKSFFHEFPPCLGWVRLRYLFTGSGDRLEARKTGLTEAPRAFLTDQWEVLPGDQVLERTLATGPSADGKVYLGSDPDLGPKVPTGGPAGTLEWKDLSSDEIEFKVRLSRPELLVVTDNYSEGWRVQPLDGGTTGTGPVMPANGFQRAVPLAAGDHHFILRYRPTAYVVGKWVSILSWLSFALLSFRRRFFF